jgi:hypothetical protein
MNEMDLRISNTEHASRAFAGALRPIPGKLASTGTALSRMQKLVEARWRVLERVESRWRWKLAALRDHKEVIQTPSRRRSLLKFWFWSRRLFGRMTSIFR